MASKLDTSGAIYDNRHGSVAGRAITKWSDLSPFTQGYIEALFASSQPLNKIGKKLGAFVGAAGFSDLAPETLARIIADCAGAQRSGYDDTTYAGAIFWRERQEGHEPPFPPLTVQLDDDGKVRFA